MLGVCEECGEETAVGYVSDALMCRDCATEYLGPVKAWNFSGNVIWMGEG